MKPESYPGIDPQACRRVAGELWFWIDGELDALARARLEGHLEGCAACRAEWDARRELLITGGRAFEVSTSELAWARAGLRARLESAQAATQSTAWRPWALAAAAGLAWFLLSQWLGAGALVDVARAPWGVTQSVRSTWSDWSGELDLWPGS